jgi:UPF0716 protein FxsA
MALILFLLFLGVPIAEITLFVVVGERIGIVPTIAIVIATAVAGAALVRKQGLDTLERARRDLDRNVLPTGALSEGLAILVAGVLLLTPGFLTDAIGFALLVPPVRAAVIAALGKWLAGRVTVVDIGSARGPDPRGGSGQVIDAEATEIDENDDTGPRSDAKSGVSPWRGDRI